MSPARNKHGYFQARIVVLLSQLMPHGNTLTEAAVETEDGYRVPDVTWIPKERWAVHREEFSLSQAPEICVEVYSPSNSEQEMNEKRDLLFQKGAVEFWYCDEKGHMRFQNRNLAVLKHSELCPSFPLRIGE